MEEIEREIKENIMKYEIKTTSNDILNKMKKKKFSFKLPIIISTSFALACSVLLCGLCGYTIASSKNLPLASTTAILHPLTYPGSNPITTFPFSGGCKSRFFIFSPNTLIALSCANSVR